MKDWFSIIMGNATWAFLFLSSWAPSQTRAALCSSLPQETLNIWRPSNLGDTQCIFCFWISSDWIFSLRVVSFLDSTCTFRGWSFLGLQWVLRVYLGLGNFCPRYQLPKISICPRYQFLIHSQMIGLWKQRTWNLFAISSPRNTSLNFYFSLQS